MNVTVSLLKTKTTGEKTEKFIQSKAVDDNFVRNMRDGLDQCFLNFFCFHNKVDMKHFFCSHQNRWRMGWLLDGIKFKKHCPRRRYPNKNYERDASMEKHNVSGAMLKSDEMEESVTAWPRPRNDLSHFWRRRIQSYVEYTSKVRAPIRHNHVLMYLGEA